LKVSDDGPKIGLLHFFSHLSNKITNFRKVDSASIKDEKGIREQRIHLCLLVELVSVRRSYICDLVGYNQYIVTLKMATAIFAESNDNCQYPKA
jgi:hypothetical protein